MELLAQPQTHDTPMWTRLILIHDGLLHDHRRRLPGREGSGQQMLSFCRDAEEFSSDSDLRSNGAPIGGRSVAAQGIQSLPLGLDRSGLQLVTVTDRHRSGRRRAHLGVAMILSAWIRPSMRQSKRWYLCRCRSPDRSIGLLGTGAAEGGEEGVGPAGDVVVVDSFA